MSYTVIFKEEADYDVFDARKWYESRREGLGDELLDEIEEYKGFRTRSTNLPVKKT